MATKRLLWLLLSLLFVIEAGCGTPDTPSIELTASYVSLYIRSKADRTMTNVHISGEGIDELVIPSIEPNQTCEMQVTKGGGRWMPQDGEKLIVSCDEFPKPLVVSLKNSLKK